MQRRDSNSNISTFSVFLRLWSVGSIVSSAMRASKFSGGDGEEGGRQSNARKQTKTSLCPIWGVTNDDSWGH